MKAYLKWLIPIIALYVMVGAACLFYREIVREEAYLNELNMISANVQEGLYGADTIIKRAADCNDTAAIALSEYSFSKDKDSIQRLLENLMYEDKVVACIVCDNEGKGIDANGNAVSLTGEAIFDEIRNTYSKGGSGQLLVHDSKVLYSGSIAEVSRVEFADQIKGYLITDVYVNDLYDRIFYRIKYADKMALVSINGEIIAGEDVGTNLWEDSTYDLQVDTIKLNISQGNRYVARIDGYGFVIVVPSKITKGAAVAIYSKEELSRLIRPAMRRYRFFVMLLCAIMFIYILLNFAVFGLSKIIRKIILNSAENKEKIDALTGLYNKIGFDDRLNNYIQSASMRSGVLFSLVIDNPEKVSNETLKTFGSRLSNVFRAADLYSRYSDSQFLVFLKDIKEEKDIRKQTDELQLFLFDMKNEIGKHEPGTVISAGRAIMPRNGTEASKLIEEAVRAMELSRAEGRGSINFGE
nr:diguanylate cyclase [uncultured Butyrivibrio sp.]